MLGDEQLTDDGEAVGVGRPRRTHPYIIISSTSALSIPHVKYVE